MFKSSNVLPHIVQHEANEALTRASETENVVQLTTVAALGVGLIHEMSQPLSAAATFIHAAQRLLKTNDYDRYLLADIVEKAAQELKQTRDVLVRLRDAVSAEQAIQVPLDLVALTQMVADQLRGEAKERSVRVMVEPGSLPTMFANAVQIKQVLLNLIGNAIDAAAETANGIVSVRCRHDRTTAEIEVSDNGKGIDFEIAEHVFQPFQTTKPRGMGLGLPLSRQIAEAHGGHLWWEFVLPQGTNIPPSIAASEFRRSCSLNIQFMSWTMTLRCGLPYQFCCRRRDLAEGSLHRRRHSLRRLTGTSPFARWSMSSCRGMTGLALQQQLVDRDVEAALIFMSGQADVPMAVQAMRAGASDFIQKPFDPEKLLEVVDDALTHQCELKELRSRSDETLKNLQSLTLREREVLTLLVEGNLNKMIAARLGISIRTVEHHRSHIMAKMNARTLSHLVRMSFGIIEPSLLHQK